SSRRRHTRSKRDWSSDVCSSDLLAHDIGAPARDTEDLRRRAYIVRKRLDTEGIYFPSLSPATITYKGMLSTGQLASYFTELSDEIGRASCRERGQSAVGRA